MTDGGWEIDAELTRYLRINEENIRLQKQVEELRGVLELFVVGFQSRNNEYSIKKANEALERCETKKGKYDE